jgi:asparagine synthase (glutamine-hydrolysing)
MCGIAGFFNPHMDYTADEQRWKSILEKMNDAQKRRGPDDRGIYLDHLCGLAHVRLEIIDLVTGQQPMVHRRNGRECTIVFNGEIYNMDELKKELIREGAVFETTSDTEVILEGYMHYGTEYIKKLNGIFAIALWDSASGELHLFRDRLGVKPLFYTMNENTLIFSSEIKGLLAYPGVTPMLDREGLCEIFAIGPAKTYGKGVFKGVLEVLPGQCITFDRTSHTEHFYWKLKSAPHEDSLEKTIEKTAWLVEDAVKKQMLSDIPISTFLSGGLDSSLVTAICSRELKKQGKMLNTFSFDFVNNDKYFKSNSFQPSQDRPYAEQMVEFAGTNHRFLECSNQDQLDCLFKTVDARDLPCMADVESSMLYFCSKVTGYNKVTLTGECADE